MTVMEFFGCSFIAFGLPVALFIFTIARNPIRVIILIASSFFWLIALLLSSLLWYAVVPLREDLAFGLVFSVLFQEGFRLVFYLILAKAEPGMKKLAEKDNSPGVGIVANKHLMAYVCGLGFGMISGAFSLVNVLADMTGPGTIGINGHHPHFFIASAFLTLCFVLLHVFWGVIFYDGLDKKKNRQYIYPAVVILTHLLVSCVTLVNEGKKPLYGVSITICYIVMCLMGAWAFRIAGGSMRSLKAFFSRSTTGYNMERT